MLILAVYCKWVSSSSEQITRSLRRLPMSIYRHV